MRGMTKQKRGKNSVLDISFCEEKRRRINEFADAYHAVMDLQTQQLRAAIDHDTDFSRFDDLIHMAKQKKDEAKYAVIAHISEHRCW